MDQASFESTLQNGLFTEYFNCFLALPIFSRTIQYNVITKEFEEVDLLRAGQSEKTYEPQDALQADSLMPPSVTHSHAPSICGDNYISTLERSKALEWIQQERLPAFQKSDLYSEYKLANLISSQDMPRRQLPSVPRSMSLNCVAVSGEFEGGVDFQVLASKKEMAGLKKFLVNTKGENDFLFWIECERLTVYKRGSPELSIGLRDVKEKYIAPGAKCELAKGRWEQRSQPMSLDDIFNLQNRVLMSLVSYWCPRYLMRACRRVMKSKVSKRSRPVTHQGRSSVLNESQMSALRCESQALRETASPLILPQLSPTHFPLSSTPTHPPQMPTARSFSVIASINKLPYIRENASLSESVTISKSPSATFPAEIHKRKRSKSVPLPKIIPPVKEEKFYQQLTRCLSIEHRKAGGVFQQYIEKIGNEQWRNCLLCWREIQGFKAGFLSEDFNPFQVETRAKTIFSKHVLSSGEMWVSGPHEVAEVISRSIYPAFDDLFDSLEEHALQVLTEPWQDCVCREHEFLEQIPKSDEGAAVYQWDKFEDDDEYIEELEVASEEAVEEKEKSPVETSDSGEEVDEEDDDKTRMGVGKDTPLVYTFQQVIQDNTMLNLFKSFLDSKHASVDIMFWMEVESFRRIPVIEKNLRNAKAKLIRSQYLTKNYYFSANSPASKEAQHRMVTLGGGKFGQKIPQRPPTPVLVEGQKQVQAKLEHRWLPVFVKTREFLHYAFPGQDHKKMSLQASVSNPEEWKNKVFESRWMTNRRDITNCRKSILNPITCKPFETFIELKSSRDEHLKNDLNFWLEIERFKELWHVHTPKAALQLKVDVIVSCFLQSKVPPKIQVDLMQELVERLMKKSVGPYMFREAQDEMFRVIFSYWMEYQTFKDQHKGEDIEIAFMELRQQVHEKELARQRRQKEFEQKKIAQMRPFGIGQIHLPGEEDHAPDVIFRLSDVEGESNGISTKKKIGDPMTSPLTKIMAAQ